MVVMSGVGLIDNLQRGLSVGGAKAVRFHANTAAHATLQDVLPTTALTRTDGEDDGPSRHFQLRNGHIQTVRGHNGPSSVTVTVTSQGAASRSAGSSSGGGTAGGRSRSGSPVFPSALRSSGTAAEQWAASGSELQGLSDWYVATNGSQWLDSAGWPATSCAALGVTCSSTGAVVYVRPVCRLHPFVFLLLIGLLTNDEHACVAGASLDVCAAAASS